MPASHYSTPSQWIILVLFWVLSVSSIQVAATQETPSRVDEIVPTGLERVVWRKTPIAIPLVVGEERLIHFPGSVSIGLPQALTSTLRSQSINGTLYLLAGQPFESTRVMVRSENGGPLFVLDISAALNLDERPTLPDVQVVLDTIEAEAEDVPSYTVTANQFNQWGYVALTRFAAQQLYAPERLIPNVPGVVAIPVKDAPVDLLRGGSVEAVLVAAWKAGLRYVTAVRLTNQTSKPVILDPRELRGAWLAATFQHNRLLPSGSDADTSAVYLISDRTFDVALW
ncbi:TIGR03749 family integrating conjugative element protein [Mangrovimicrobium sediminis]|uniref:TIGR03749 family integrating conjugative element protein n=1 Tax=Mangrovimicrobium sediminis TaxID=2562682 RepID=A0A4Z0LXZ9_9GAMM|nr:TIGR03749 family integrating conjugative element protein [Haliea sp. SAOS-164]TGD72159.1 TIGR03749 family integrating conjugative element protein [Haliea sp. SAOS-164]